MLFYYFIVFISTSINTFYKDFNNVQCLLSIYKLRWNYLWFCHCPFYVPYTYTSFYKNFIDNSDKKIDEHWAIGDCHGRRGLLPLNYVEFKEANEPKLERKVDVGLSASALYDYQAVNDDEISFDPDELITNIDPNMVRK